VLLHFLLPRSVDSFVCVFRLPYEQQIWLVARHNVAPRLEEKHVVCDIFVCGVDSPPALAAQRTLTVVISLSSTRHPLLMPAQPSTSWNFTAAPRNMGRLWIYVGTSHGPVPLTVMCSVFSAINSWLHSADCGMSLSTQWVSIKQSGAKLKSALIRYWPNYVSTN